MVSERERAYAKVYREAHKEHYKELMKKWREENKDYIKAYSDRYHNENKDKIKAYYTENKDRLKAVADRRKHQICVEVLSHYSNGTLKCAHCGEADFVVLCIDHINGGGGKQRRELHRWGWQFYYWLKKNNYPEGYQVLCHNCNFRKTLRRKR